MRLSHTRPVASAVFDEPNLMPWAGLVPVLALARSAGLHELAQRHLSVPTDRGANTGLKVACLVAGMIAGADTIDDMALLPHGGMGRVFAGAYAPSTLGSFLRLVTFGHVRQLDAVASRFMVGLAARTPVVAGLDDPGGYVLVDIDDTIIEVHGHAKQALDGLGVLRPPRGGRRASSRSAGVGHRPPGPQGQSRHRDDPPGRVDRDPVHRRGLRRGRRAVGVPR